MPPQSKRPRVEVEIVRDPSRRTRASSHREPSFVDLAGISLLSLSLTSELTLLTSGASDVDRASEDNYEPPKASSSKVRPRRAARKSAIAVKSDDDDPLLISPQQRSSAAPPSRPAIGIVEEESSPVKRQASTAGLSAQALEVYGDLVPASVFLSDPDALDFVLSRPDPGTSVSSEAFLILYSSSELRCSGATPLPVEDLPLGPQQVCPLPRQLYQVPALPDQKAPVLLASPWSAY